MPDAGPYSGNDGSVSIGSNVIAQVTNFKYSVSLNTRMQTKLGDEYDQAKGGHKSVSGTIDCWLDRSDTSGQEAIVVGAELTLKLRHGGSATGAPETTITALVTGKDVDNGDGNSTVGANFSFVGAGAAQIIEGEVT